LFVVAFGVIAAPEARAQPETVGTIVVAHGGGSDWNALVAQAVAEVRTGGPVTVSFLMGPGAAQHRFQDAARMAVEAGATRLVVVPLLVSSRSGHYEQIRYLTRAIDTLSADMQHHLQVAGVQRPDPSVPMVLTPAIDADPAIVPVFVDRATALADLPAEQAVFLIGHGPAQPDDYAMWMADFRKLSAAVGRAGFLDVKAGLLWDDSPAPVRAEAVQRIREIIALQHKATGQDVVVVPVLISRGRVSDEKIPADLRGLPVAYSGEGLLPHPAVARWIEQRVTEAARSNGGPRAAP
jgi:sirohydrochlorin ferrochelatase